MSALEQIIMLVMQIVARHAATNVGAPPLTAAQVQALLIAEIQKGEDRDLAWFLLKGLTPPV